MDDFDDDEWAEMQEMYINHTFKEMNSIKDNIDSAHLTLLEPLVIT